MGDGGGMGRGMGGGGGGVRVLLSQASLGSEVYLETIRTFAMDVKVH